MNAYDFLLEAEASRDAIAIIDADNRAWRYADVSTLVEHLSGFVEQCSLPGDCCLIYAESGLFWLCNFMAILRAGRNAVPVPADASSELLSAVIRDCNPRLAFVEPSLLANIQNRANPRLAIVSDTSEAENQIIEWSEASAFLPSEASYQPPADATAALLFGMQGGIPRAVMLTHANLACAAGNLEQTLALKADDRVLCLSPLWDISAAVLACAQIRGGGTTLFAPRLSSSSSALARAVEHHVTGLFLGEQSMNQLASATPSAMVNTLRFIAHSSPHPIHRHLTRLAGELSAPWAYSLYARDETTGPALVCAGSPAEPLPSEFVPITGLSYRIVSELGQVLPEDVEGELCIQGPTVARGYWQPLPTARRVLSDNMFRTGDLAVVTADNHCRITGRLADYVHVAGRRLDARPIEQALGQFPGVVDVALVETRSSGSDDLLLLVVHPRGEEVRNSFFALCRDQIPGIRRADQIRFTQRLPRSVNGELDREQLESFPLYASDPAPIANDYIHA